MSRELPSFPVYADDVNDPSVKPSTEKFSVILPSLVPFLQLKPPATTQENIEFNQTFKLPLSSNFYNVYNHSYSLTYPENIPSQIKRDEYIKSQKMIDRRPLRWYRELSKLSRNIEEHKFNIAQADTEIANCKKRLGELSSGSIPDKEKFSDEREEINLKLKESYYGALREREGLIRLIERDERQRTKVINEIFVAGYLHKRNEKNEDEIYRPVPDEKISPPLTTDRLNRANLEKDWEDLLKELEKVIFIEEKLLTSNLISKNKIEQYIQEKNNLMSTDTLPAIKAYEVKINKEIESLKIQIAELNAACEKGEGPINLAIKQYGQEILKINNEIVRLQNEITKLNVDLAYNRKHHNWDWVATITANIAFDQQQIAKLTQNKVWFQNEIVKLTNEKGELMNKINADLALCESKISALQQQLGNKDNWARLLREARVNFLLYWNNPKNYDIPTPNQSGEKVLDAVHVSSLDDPLHVFYRDINKNKVNKDQSYQIQRFNFKNDGFYNEENVSLQDFMKLSDRVLANQIAIFPYVDKSGKVVSEVFIAVVGPRKPEPGTASELRLPAVKLVETHNLEVSWSRYALGPLKDTVNLFPGEKKQIVVEKQTKLTRTVNQSRTEGQEEKRHLTSSLEDNLRNELSNDYNVSQSDQNAKRHKRSQTDTNKSASGTTEEDKDTDSTKISAGGSYGGFSGSYDDTLTSEHSKKSSQAQSKESALAVSETEDSQTLSKYSRDTADKAIQNTISKVSSETSSNNKLDITLASSEQYEETSGRKETIDMNNPNVGRTINYNFYQLQNVYKTFAKLKDVKIVLNTGIEIVDGTGITDKRIYELEEFNKIYKGTDKSEMSIVLCAFIARKMLKNYTNLFDAEYMDKNNGILKFKTSSEDSETVKIMELMEIYKQLDLKDLWDSSEKSQTNDERLKKGIVRLSAALDRLQKFTFKFNEKLTIGEGERVVNAPAYHVDAQLGLIPATEPYLERRRELEHEEKKVNIEERRAIIDFHKEFPHHHPYYPPHPQATHDLVPLKPAHNINTLIGDTSKGLIITNEADEIEKAKRRSLSELNLLEAAQRVVVEETNQSILNAAVEKSLETQASISLNHSPLTVIQKPLQHKINSDKQAENAGAQGLFKAVTPAQKLAKVTLQVILNKKAGVFNEEGKTMLLLKLEKELKKDKYAKLIETGNIRELALKIADSATDVNFGISLDDKKLHSEMVRTGMGI